MKKFLTAMLSIMMASVCAISMTACTTPAPEGKTLYVYLALDAATYADRTKWNQMALVNIAKSGIFASDRSIRDYANNIWHVPTRKLK